ncbi:hypothetical protein P153DRAFT_63898 [Dothidotthia symphoricarpi CBS 119687]|uniref:Uncharacterized protein n=1 Tax=Dothidotthia symphoricarpi CBS 119687 TaxID=1392245 RepID=A0A6A6A8Z7_9PLEO|nr:uncharacterized protein P153DRAFT_63898 [Dothidotthia symphoricarpi CBS 119687]KAF2127307.1 hypothetical protein P153DRAFT_63898 [Dothidotthia symphoricarpi CBS 119687]
MCYLWSHMSTNHAQRWGLNDNDEPILFHGHLGHSNHKYLERSKRMPTATNQFHHLAPRQQMTSATTQTPRSTSSQTFNTQPNHRTLAAVTRTNLTNVRQNGPSTTSTSPPDPNTQIRLPASSQPQTTPSPIPFNPLRTHPYKLRKTCMGKRPTLPSINRVAIQNNVHNPFLQHLSWRRITHSPLR